MLQLNVLIYLEITNLHYSLLFILSWVGISYTNLQDFQASPCCSQFASHLTNRHNSNYTMV